MYFCRLVDPQCWTCLYWPQTCGQLWSVLLLIMRRSVIICQHHTLHFFILFSFLLLLFFYCCSFMSRIGCSVCLNLVIFCRLIGFTTWPLLLLSLDSLFIQCMLYLLILRSFSITSPTKCSYNKHIVFVWTIPGLNYSFISLRVCWMNDGYDKVLTFQVMWDVYYNITWGSAILPTILTYFIVFLSYKVLTAWAIFDR